MPEAAAIYARISADRDGLGLGVARQIEDCQALAEARGWPVAEIYTDDDTSAYSDKPRPAYQRLLADVAEGLRDAMVVYHLDRLHRRPKELEEFVEVCQRAGVRDLATVQGAVDLDTGDGLFMARIMGAVAANESATKSRRILRKNAERAQQGLPHGPTRPFGYEADRLTVREAEAAVVADLAERLLAGESLNSLTTWLNEQQIPTVHGKPWRPGTVRQMLRGGRLSGQREHRGEIIGPAAWPAILTPEQTDRIRALLDDPTRRTGTGRTPRRYLLTGLLRCQRCGAQLYSHPRNGVRRYVCKTDPNFAGCGKTYIASAPVEELITEAILYRLDSPELRAALTGHSDGDEQAARLRGDIAADRDQLEELARLYADRDISAREWKAARDPIETRIRQAEQSLARVSNTTVLAGYVGNSTSLRQHWGQPQPHPPARHHRRHPRPRPRRPAHQGRPVRPRPRHARVASVAGGLGCSRASARGRRPARPVNNTTTRAIACGSLTRTATPCSPQERSTQQATCSRSIAMTPTPPAIPATAAHRATATPAAAGHPSGGRRTPAPPTPCGPTPTPPVAESPGRPRSDATPPDCPRRPCPGTSPNSAPPTAPPPDAQNPPADPTTA